MICRSSFYVFCHFWKIGKALLNLIAIIKKTCSLKPFVNSTQWNFKLIVEYVYITISQYENEINIKIHDYIEICIFISNTFSNNLKQSNVSLLVTEIPDLTLVLVDVDASSRFSFTSTYAHICMRTIYVCVVGSLFKIKFHQQNFKYNDNFVFAHTSSETFDESRLIFMSVVF